MTRMGQLYICIDKAIPFLQLKKQLQIEYVCRKKDVLSITGDSYGG